MYGLPSFLTTPCDLLIKYMVSYERKMCSLSISFSKGTDIYLQIFQSCKTMADDIAAKLEALRAEGWPFPAVLRPHQESLYILDL